MAGVIAEFEESAEAQMQCQGWRVRAENFQESARARVNRSATFEGCFASEMRGPPHRLAVIMSSRSATRRRKKGNEMTNAKCATTPAAFWKCKVMAQERTEASKFWSTNETECRGSERKTFSITDLRKARKGTAKVLHALRRVLIMPTYLAR